MSMGRAFQAVCRFYRGQTARRSGVPLIAHVAEGLVVLDRLNATEVTKAAFCLHPLFQADDDLAVTLAAGGHLCGQDPAAVLLAMEYRHQANGHLSHHPPKVPTWGPLDEVKQMLIADKVQNRKDFEQHLQGRVANSDRLDAYFKEWLDALGVSESRYTELKP